MRPQMTRMGRMKLPYRTELMISICYIRVIGVNSAFGGLPKERKS